VRSRNNALIGPRSDFAARSLSSEAAGPLRLYISDAPPGLAFLYDPILLESPDATYVVQWSEVKASRKARAYITTVKEKHAELHTFMYTPRKVRHPLLDRLSVRRLVVMTFPQPLNRTFGIISVSDVGAWPISKLFGTPWARYFFIPPLLTLPRDSRGYVS